MDQISRIEHMETILNQAGQALQTLCRAMEEYEKLRPQLKELIEYYESPQWMADYQADEQGLLPRNLHRGVLSEDAVYDLLTERAALLQTWEKWLKEDAPC